MAAVPESRRKRRASTGGYGEVVQIHDTERPAKRARRDRGPAATIWPEVDLKDVLLDGLPIRATVDRTVAPREGEYFWRVTHEYPKTGKSRLLFEGWFAVERLLAEVTSLVEDSSEEVENITARSERGACEHVNQTYIDLTSPEVLRLVNRRRAWVCQSCNEPSGESVWVCLTCLYTGCSRYDAGHAEAHSRTANHPLALELNSRMFHCNDCGTFVFNDNPRGDLKLLKQMLDQAESQSFETKTLRLRRRKENEPVPTSTTVVTKSVKPAVKLAPALVRTGGRVGLYNLGNTCYINAVLQNLSNMAPFREYFLALPVAEQSAASAAAVGRPVGRRQRAKVADDVQWNLRDEVTRVMHQLWFPESGSINPHGLLESVLQKMPKFQRNQQQDAHEFLLSLLDGLHGDMNRTHGLSTATSMVHEIFRGTLKNSVRCTKCGHESSKTDPFLDLSLDLPHDEESCDIMDCVTAFTRPEALPDDYKCPKCKSTTGSMKQLSIATLPKILCLHLKRFRNHDGSKESMHVEFPLTNFRVAAMNLDHAKAKYALIGLVEHHGSVASGGHYTAYCLAGDGQWMSINDSSIRNARREDVSNAQAYILFYQKVDYR